MSEPTITYSTSQIAQIVGLHPNTVRKYEEWGLIQKPERKQNGYRVYTPLHVKQFELVKKAFEIAVLQAGLRDQIIQVVKLSAKYRFDDAILLAGEYIEIARREIMNAREAAALCETFLLQSSEPAVSYRRAQAAKELGLTIDTIRNWEMNGLIEVKRKENGYRVYTADDMKRLKIIRSLRCANYSLSAILRMLTRLEQGAAQNCEDILNLLNTPEDGEDIVSACDKLVDSLEHAIGNASEGILILEEMKKMKSCNPTL